MEFNLTVRSLASFLKNHKNVGLVVIDGTHLIESVEIYSSKDRGGDKNNQNSAVKTRKTVGNVHAMIHNDIPTSEDFFGGDSSRSSLQQPAASNQQQNIRQSFNLKRGGKIGSRLDFNYFDSKLIERAIALLQDYKKIYQFAVINCIAKPNLRKTADLLEQVMTRGLQPDQIPK